MFCIIYKFEVKPGQQESFEKAWRGLTLLIYEYEGSLGSRLHREDELTYIAYAQWPSKEVFEDESVKLPESSNELRKIMRASCSAITTLHELDMTDDLLQDKTSR